MARWDEILTLPVQNPPTPEFSAADIVWSRVEGWRETMDRLALIPFTRVSDFVRGESNNKDCPTRFHVEARRRRPPEMTNKPKVDGILEYILYWCSFGPDDHRKGGVVRPSRNYNAKRKTPAGRPNTKRGCVCHFIVKRLIAEPSVALVIYNQDKHVDKQGTPCHGPQDKKAAGTRAMFAPYISDELRLQLLSLLYVGVPVETIMQRHTEMVEKQGGPSNRDDLLNHRYVRRLERKIRRSSYEFDHDDDVSLRLWIENHQNLIFFFEDFSDSEPFVLGIQTEWQLQQMIRFGNHRLLACDSKFGANKLKYPIYSLLVFDKNNNAIPVAWIITPNFASNEIHRWMGHLYDRVRTKDPTWNLGGFIVDDPSADVHSIREVFKCSVLISFWRLRHAWHKNLMERCSEMEMCANMLRRLGEVVFNSVRGNDDIDLVEAFMEDFIDCSDFLDYFKAVWFPRIGAWTTALKALPLASSEVTAALECYHYQLRLRLLNEKDSSTYQRADWLVDKLGTMVHSYYWLDEYSEKDSFARYWKDEWKSGLTSWCQALQIPDSGVILDGKCAKVGGHREEMHTVFNPGSEFAICDCDWAKIGNLCKHVIKSSRICRDRGLATPSAGLLQYNRTLMSILDCPPHDSVIRDHAVALAVSVQTQLSVLFDLQNDRVYRASEAPEEQQAPACMGVCTDNMENVDKASGNENQLVSGSDEVCRDESNPVAKEYVSQEVIIGNNTDVMLQHVEAPISGSPPIQQQVTNKTTIINGIAVNEEGNLLNISPTLTSNINNSSKVGDECLDDMLIDSCSEVVASSIAIADQDSCNVIKNSFTEKAIDICPYSFQSFPSTSKSEVVGSPADEDSTFQLGFDLPKNKKSNKDEGACPCEPMIIDMIKVSSGICDGALQESVHFCDSDKNAVENASLDQEIQDNVAIMIIDTIEDNNYIYDGTKKESLVDCHRNNDQNNVAIKSGVAADVIRNIVNQEQTTGRIAVDHDCGEYDDKTIISTSEVCDSIDKESPLSADVNVSGMNLRPCYSDAEACVLSDAVEENLA